MRKTATVLAVVAQVVLLACLVSGTSSADTAIPGLGDILQPKPAPEPETLALSGTIRDFKQSHPDFEKFGGVDHGIVTGNLGPDRKPVYASSTRTPTTTGKQDFDQWYRDVPNVNLRTEYGIVLNRVSGSDPAIYHYVNPAFFPIDGKLWGNEGQPHNYWFTYELHNTFTYRGGEKFTFTGDDDVWVYINNRKAIDLGGVHPPMTGSVDLDAQAGELGLVKGRTYPFDLFFAERHTTGSTFDMDTSIALLQPKPAPPPRKKP